MNFLVLILDREIVERLKQVGKFCHLNCRILFPTFLGSLFVIRCRSYEIEAASIPQLMNKVHAALHQRNNLFKVLDGGSYAM